ncbi:Fe-S oxidoreductase [Thermococcus sp. EP1]|uniref:SPASM domain-containing protein n=1 Tax=Thermococcus sp. EP1 TaxID=1591054 RepID=UPI0006DA97E1|nr:SPASM domain-containing protein [Thermococcus sp. EP1]KPU64030.1 Fe-S oxidoreductase [Thermococcus sp. EP1]
METVRNNILWPKPKNITAFAKPPWAEKEHTGKLERLIVQLGAGNGKFSEITGIPRSIGCIGNNRFILREDPVEVDRIKEILYEFSLISGGDLYLTNYDDPRTLEEISNYAASLDIENVYAVVKLEDFNKISLSPGVKPIVELEYSKENVEKAVTLEDVHALLLMVQSKEVEKVFDIPFYGEIYVDLLFPGSLRKVDFDLMEVKRVYTPTPEYHPCLSGTLAITGEGFVLPCPLLRNFIGGNIKQMTLKQILRKRKLKRFWKLKKASLEACNGCPFAPICHDCRALEYRASGDIYGIEYCPLDGEFFK